MADHSLNSSVKAQRVNRNEQNVMALSPPAFQPTPKQLKSQPSWLSTDAASYCSSLPSTAQPHSLGGSTTSIEDLQTGTETILVRPSHIEQVVASLSVADCSRSQVKSMPHLEEASSPQQTNADTYNSHNIETELRKIPATKCTSKLSNSEGVPLDYDRGEKDSSVSPFRTQNPRRSLQGLVTPLSHGVQGANRDVTSSDKDAEDEPVETISAIEESGSDPTPHAREYASEAIRLIARHEQMDGRVNMATPSLRPDPSDERLHRLGKRRVLLQKHSTQLAQFLVNLFFIFGTWWWSRYYYVFLPFITTTVALNVVMVIDVIIFKLKHVVKPEKKTGQAPPEAFVMVIPCYNETKEELQRSLESLCGQVEVDQHPRAIMIICDGKVRGPGMLKTTADYLLEDILLHYDERRSIKSAYLAWDQQFMNIVLQKGSYGGLPYCCIIKEQNQGKRDSLIVIRSFLYNFNIRDTIPTVIFSPALFGDLSTWLLHAGIDHVDHLIGMDADTVFEEQCIVNLLQESRYPKTVGVCGYVAVDYSQGNWNVWRLYQSAEYTIAQCLRRLHQSTVTKKVSCLPGCCQLLKICEETCGQEVLIEKFGYCPSITDGLLTHIRATASEDRNHVCHMLSARPHVETRQALGARAITDVPHTWSVFLSQRRRWTLGATSNDLLLAFAPGVQWFERILAFVNVATWFLNPFILACIANFIYACFHVELKVIMAFVSVMIVPIAYYLVVPLWLCRDVREAFQFWAGCSCYIILGPFINISVLLYACCYMDSFGWGKTRKIVQEDISCSTVEKGQIDVARSDGHGEVQVIAQSSAQMTIIEKKAKHIEV